MTRASILTESRGVAGERQGARERVHGEEAGGVRPQLALVDRVRQARVVARVRIVCREREEGCERCAVVAHGGAVLAQREGGRVVVEVGHAHAHRGVPQQAAAVAGHHRHLPLGAPLAVQRHARRERTAVRVDRERLAELSRRYGVGHGPVLAGVVVVGFHLRMRTHRKLDEKFNRNLELRS